MGFNSAFKGLKIGATSHSTTSLNTFCGGKTATLSGQLWSIIYWYGRDTKLERKSRNKDMRFEVSGCGSKRKNIVDFKFGLPVVLQANTYVTTVDTINYVSFELCNMFRPN